MKALLVAWWFAGGLVIAGPSAGQAPALGSGDPPAGPVVWPPPARVGDGSECSQALVGSGTTFNVGPGQTYTELTQVPWLSLQAGDVVNVFHRAEPYRTKIGLRAQGTVSAPVILNGVTDASCRRPEINAQNAVTANDAAQASFFSKQHSENLGAIFIYQGRADPWGYKPRNIVIQNFRITGAHTSNTYTAQDGSTGTYSLGAAAIYAVRVEGLTVQNNEITGNGNGVFVNSRGDDDFSSHITIRRNRIHDNGNVKSYTEHNLYIQAVRALYEGNYIGQLRVGAVGSSMKDRSSATVIRFNHIVAAARAIDLVEIEGGVAPVKNDPLYDHAWVYGNLIESDHDKPATSSTLIIHWGGDNDPRYFRNGTLYFYNNTVVTRATEKQAYYLCIFDLPTTTQRVELASNVFVHVGTGRLNLGYKSGTIVLRDTNWLSKGWAKGWGSEVIFTSSGARVIEGLDAGLGTDFLPRSGSALLDNGMRAAIRFPSSAHAANLDPTFRFAAPAKIMARPVRGAGLDLGAFEGP